MPPARRALKLSQNPYRALEGLLGERRTLGTPVDSCQIVEVGGDSGMGRSVEFFVDGERSPNGFFGFGEGLFSVAAAGLDCSGPSQRPHAADRRIRS